MLNPTSTLLAISTTLLGLASAAGAVTMSWISDKSVYRLGETIEITISADSEGDSADVVSVAVFHDTARVVGLGAVGPVAPEDGEIPDVFTQLSGNVTPTRGGNEGSCIVPNGEPIRCLAWDEAFFGQVAPVDAGLERSILHYTATAVGIASFEIVGDGTAGSFYFGDALGSSPSASDVGLESFTVTIVPEPASGALLGLGLLGLAARGRRTPRVR